MNKNLINKIKKIIQSEKLNIDLNLSDDLLIHEFKDKVHWFKISIFQKLSEDFIEKFQNKVDWIHISIHQKLSEKFIEKFQDELDWWCISQTQKISESFIEKFQNKVDWKHISIHQNLSEGFILKYWHRLDHNLIIQNQKTNLTSTFLFWLYRTYQEEEYGLLKNKNRTFLKHAKKIEEEVKIVLIEIN